MNEQCIFCAIIDKKIPADIVFEDEQFIAFKDINPMASVHILLVPKTHYDSLNEIPDDDSYTLSNLFIYAKKVARQLGLFDSGYRLLINTGKNGGQTVPHLHMHILTGKITVPDQVDQ
jgi:histidine triad (HIT) family protein